LYIMAVVVNLNHYLGMNLDHFNNDKGVYFFRKHNKSNGYYY